MNYNYFSACSAHDSAIKLGHNHTHVIFPRPGCRDIIVTSWPLFLSKQVSSLPTNPDPPPDENKRQREYYNITSQDKYKIDYISGSQTSPWGPLDVSQFCCSPEVAHLIHLVKGLIISWQVQSGMLTLE
jgi:hypothetical protein